MDIFACPDEGEPVSGICNHPYLIGKGLRDRPMLVVNGMTQFVNIVLYFELPSWVTSWDTTTNPTILQEQEDDPPEMKCLKRFLFGDDTYRNKRLKILTAIVDAPLAVKA